MLFVAAKQHYLSFFIQMCSDRCIDTNATFRQCKQLQTSIHAQYKQTLLSIFVLAWIVHTGSGIMWWCAIDFSFRGKAMPPSLPPPIMQSVLQQHRHIHTQSDKTRSPYWTSYQLQHPASGFWWHRCPSRWIPPAAVGYRGCWRGYASTCFRPPRQLKTQRIVWIIFCSFSLARPRTENRFICIFLVTLYDIVTQCLDLIHLIFYLCE